MGDTENGEKASKTVFVTVGTTLFDALVRVVDSLEVKQELLKRGYTNLVIQMGRGSYTPTKVLHVFVLVSDKITVVYSNVLLKHCFFLVWNWVR